MRGSYQRVGKSRTRLDGPAPTPTPPRVTPRPTAKLAGRQRLIKPWLVPKERTFYVHAHGPTVRDNKASGLNHPLVLIRRSDRLGEMVIARHVELPGPSKLVHRHSTPLPQTENNAVAVLETTTPVVAYFDPPNPQIAYSTEVPLESCVKVTLDGEEWDRRAQKATHFIRW